MRKVAVGYCIPLLISFLTFIAEMSLNRCAWGKPRVAIQHHKIVPFSGPFVDFFSAGNIARVLFLFVSQVKGKR